MTAPPKNINIPELLSPVLGKILCVFLKLVLFCILVPETEVTVGV